MARSLNEIQNEVITEKDNQSVLDEIDSPSSTAHWKLWTYISAAAHWTLEVLFDLYKKEVEAVAAAAVYGHDEWWVKKAFEFQYGDDLQIVEVNGVKVLKYATVDTSKQIIKRASIKSGSNGNSFLKVAAEDGSGDPIALTADQFTAFTGYVNKLMPSGSNIAPSTGSSDLVKLEISIYYNPLLDIYVIKTNVKDAINNYLANIDFNGVVMRSKLQDDIQEVEGVMDVQITNTEGKSATGDYVTFDRIYQTVAGYVKVDPAFSLDDTLTFVANS